MTRIKICGLKRSEDVAAVNAVLPDYIGFVFAGEKRRISRETARQLKALLEESGFRQLQIHQNARGWLCITAQK